MIKQQCNVPYRSKNISLPPLGLSVDKHLLALTHTMR
jgi:hypothetical protein